MASLVRMGEEYSTTAAPDPWRSRIGRKNFQKPLSAAPIICFRCKRRKATGWANSKPTPRSNPTTSTTFSFSAKPIRRASPSLPTMFAASNSGWRLEHLSRRSVGAERHLQGVFRAEAGRRRSEFAAPDGRARNHSPSGRPRTHQFLRPFLSGARRRGRLGACSRDSAGADAAAQLVFHQHLRNVFLDARHRDSHGDSCARCGRTGVCRNTPAWTNLFKDSSRKAAAFDWSKQLISWKNFFLALDRALKVYEKFPWKPLRQRALREAKQWMLEHMERTEGLAAIYPAMMNSIFALMALGHGPDDPLTWREIKEFSRFEIEEDDTIRMQPCVSPVWDTCIAMVSLEEAGVAPDHPALVKVGGMDSVEADSRSRRLAGEEQRRRAGRLGV